MSSDPNAGPLEKLPTASDFWSITLYVTPSQFWMEFGWPEFDVVIVRCPKWTSISFSMTAEVKVETLGLTLTARFGMSMHAAHGADNEGWRYTFHAHGSVSWAMAGLIKQTVSWTLTRHGLSPYGPPMIAAAPALLRLPGPSD